MPRTPRVLTDKHVYHIMLRGNDRQSIFNDNQDKQRIIEIIINKAKGNAFKILSYCIMDNHLHLAIKEEEEGLSRIMKRIATSYAIYFNKKYGRTGHVFQDRYKSEGIENEKYLLSLIRYIHQNPKKAGISSIDGYKWSSYRQYASMDSSIIDIDEILGTIANDRKMALNEFLRFCKEETEGKFIDVEEEKKITLENVYEYVKEYLAGYRIELKELQDAENKGIRDKLIKKLVKESNLSKRQIANELGLNREVVRKISMS